MVTVADLAGLVNNSISDLEYRLVRLEESLRKAGNVQGLAAVVAMQEHLGSLEALGNDLADRLSAC